MDLAIASHIESLPDKCGGKPCIRGTRIRVWDIYVASELRGKSPDQIIAQYPGLSLSQVHAALTFYRDNHEAVNRHMRATDEWVEQLRLRTSPRPLARRSALMDERDDSISS
jgi:uncharacterized protein (DUF433 family)